MSATAPCRMTRPRSTIATWSHVFSTSSSRCDERNTVRPSSTNARIRWRISRMPAGSRPFIGSSRISSAGRRAGSGRCRAAGACRASRSSRGRRRAARARRARATRRSRASAARVTCGGDDLQVLAAGQVRVEARLLDDRADAGERLAALRGLRQPEQADLAGGRPASARAACGSSSSCPRRSGRGSRTRRPRGTTRSTPSTAARSPNRFVSARVSITVSTSRTLRVLLAGCVR